MTVQEIFSKLANHMIEGLMTHEQLANYYDFLNLGGYKRLHEYHYLAETCNYRKLCRYYINHYGRLIEEGEVENPKVIPSNWYNHYRKDVDISTRKNAIKNGVESWKNWEEKTKKLYEQMYKELIEIDEVASAVFIKCFIEDVDEELKCATREMLRVASIDYDLSVIVPEQETIHHKYKELVKDVGKILC